MDADRVFIVSDLHLGSPYFHRRSFLSWLDQLPAGARLVLNGDIIDDPRKPLPEAHRQVLDRLVEESYQRPLVWVRGNHDEAVSVPDLGRIEYVDSWNLGRRLLVVHGDRLDDVMPRHALFKWLFRRFHRFLVFLGFRNVHVAEYAKRWGFLYRVLNERVARNALRAARDLEFEAIACGHTHAAMTVEQNGLRYFNTGAWTEKPLHYLQIEGERILLQVYQGEEDG